MDLKEEQAIGGDPASHWYYIAKGRAIKALLGVGLGADKRRSVLDVGAGSGVFSHMLVRDGIAQRAVCVDPNYDAATINTRSDERIRFVHNVTATDADTVLMIDVIEHVDDDVALIRDYARIVNPGTQFILSVPAFDFLWSEHDDFLEHRRRYTLDRLRASVVAAGLQPVETRYFFGMLFPAVAAMRLAANAMRGDRQAEKSALKVAPEWLN
ncbi:MAG: methyltransferase domain-containing protein, partial [Parvularculaceae bacterium]